MHYPKGNATTPASFRKRLPGRPMQGERETTAYIANFVYMASLCEVDTAFIGLTVHSRTRSHRISTVCGGNDSGYVQPEPLDRTSTLNRAASLQIGYRDVEVGFTTAMLARVGDSSTLRR